ncbi:MAG TPA: hypothetical protein DEQ09_07465, partial [Bacteroidales bacterium]|nr:hypothetical protein [Bacteroidales bacterium]
HIAAKDNLIEIAEALIRADADINLKDKYGATPLHYASAYGYFYMCDLLIYYNASIDDRTEDGNTPLITAVFAGQADISDLLLQSGASPDTPDNKGFTPLMVAAQNNDTLLIGLLLDAGCELNAINTYKYDALGLAIRNNNYKAYKYLINSLKPADYKNNNIISPVLIARKYGRTEILEELKESGFTEPPRLNFDHVKINAGIKASFRDYYTRLGISIKEPLLKLMLNAGFELKPMYSKVLVKYSSDSFYQYFDKRYVLFAGAGKEFKLYEDFRKGNFSLDINLNVGYMMSSQYRGTYIKPPDKLRIMPQTVIRWNRGKINVYAGYEFMKTDLYRIGPSWFTLGVYYDIYFDKMRSPIKTIKWY